MITLSHEEMLTHFPISYSYSDTLWVVLEDFLGRYQTPVEATAALMHPKGFAQQLTSAYHTVKKGVGFKWLERPITTIEKLYNAVESDDDALPGFIRLDPKAKYAIKAPYIPQVGSTLYIAVPNNSFCKIGIYPTVVVSVRLHNDPSTGELSTSIIMGNPYSGDSLVSFSNDTDYPLGYSGWTLHQTLEGAKSHLITLMQSEISSHEATLQELNSINGG